MWRRRGWLLRPSALPGKTIAKYPAFLPKKTLDPTIDATLVGTAAKPALQTEGLAIEAKTKRFHVDVTVSGPIVPGRACPINQRPRPAPGP